jgi:capsular exopolysaccharide synthesis family protein
MSVKSAQFTTFAIPESNKQTSHLGGIFKKYSYHWPLFAVGMLISMALLYGYLKVVNPIYEVKAALLIQDEKKTSNQQSPLRELDLMNSSKLIENEIEVFKSKQLISKVVSGLQLNVNYLQKNGLFYHDLYNESPVKIIQNNPARETNELTIDIIIKDQKSYYIISPEGEKKEHAFNENVGDWKLDTTKNINDFKGANIRIKIANPEMVALYYQKAINVSIPNKLSTAVVLSLEDQVSQRGKDVLNNLLSSYNSLASEAKIRQAESTLSFLNQRIDSLTRELSQAEKGIEHYKSERGLTDISNNARISLENMQANDARLNEVNVQLNVINGIESYINSAQNTGQVPTTFGISDLGLSNLIDKLSDLQLQRDRLLATTPETNPKFDGINRQVATTKSAIKASVNNIKASLLTTRQKLQAYNSGFKSSIKTIPTQEREYVSIKRQQVIKENLYTYLLQKREEVSVNYATILEEDRVIDQAYAGPAKKPNKAIAIAAAFMLGLLVPGAVIYRRTSGKITDVQDIKDSLKIPVISELSYSTDRDYLAANAVTTVTGEQFRSLRSRLFYIYGEKKHGRTTLVTSSLPGEGKSFVSSHLSTTLACSGRKTIILEMDLRKPKIAEAFNIKNDHPGISDFLMGSVILGETIQNSGISEDLDIISSGREINNPTELLEGPKLGELISMLRDLYDDIIIDSPPIRLVSDALILSRMADMTLYIIRQGETEKSELVFIDELANKNLLSDMHIVFNGIRRIKYGYGYDYSRYNYLTQEKKSAVSIFSNFSERF